jgi:hypothetical protein
MSNAALHPLAPASLSPESYAEVRARDHVVRYRRIGRGPSVLLGALNDDALWPELSPALAARFRVFVPELSPCALPIDPSLLAAFLEGLGTPNVALVAGGALCMPALELALGNPEQITPIVLVPDGDTNGRVDGLISSPARHDAAPLLVVHRGVAAGEAVPLIEQFLMDGFR